MTASPPLLSSQRWKNTVCDQVTTGKPQVAKPVLLPPPRALSTLSLPLTSSQAKPSHSTTGSCVMPASKPNSSEPQGRTSTPFGGMKLLAEGTSNTHEVHYQQCQDGTLGPAHLPPPLTSTPSCLHFQDLQSEPQTLLIRLTRKRKQCLLPPLSSSPSHQSLSPRC